MENRSDPGIKPKNAETKLGAGIPNVETSEPNLGTKAPNLGTQGPNQGTILG